VARLGSLMQRLDARVPLDSSLSRCVAILVRVLNRKNSRQSRTEFRTLEALEESLFRRYLFKKGHDLLRPVPLSRTYAYLQRAPLRDTWPSSWVGGISAIQLPTPVALPIATKTKLFAERRMAPSRRSSGRTPAGRACAYTRHCARRCTPLTFCVGRHDPRPRNLFDSRTRKRSVG
jgi:hypothetical protein